MDPTKDANNRQQIESVKQAQGEPANKRWLISHAVAELIFGTAAISLGIVLIPRTYDIQNVRHGLYYGNEPACDHGYVDRLRQFAKNATGIWSGVAAFILGVLGCALKKKGTKQMCLANIMTGIVTLIINIQSVLSSALPDADDLACIDTVYAMHIALMAICFIIVPIAISHTIRSVNEGLSGIALPTFNPSQRRNQIGTTHDEDPENGQGRQTF